MEGINDKLAVISDVHGNSYALAAVLEDIHNKGIDRIVNLGDSLYGPVDPFGAYQLLDNPNMTSISGNQDRLILDNLDIYSENPTLEYVKDEITHDTIDWLKKLVLCGHSHVARVLKVGEKLLVNAGSVGLQAYDDDLPHYHLMQNYSPHARYVVIDDYEKACSAKIITVEYDYESAAKKAEGNGRQDWAHYLRTGIVKNDQES